MGRKAAKRLVVDTSVARASGGGIAQDDTSISCREFLLTLRDNTKHQIVMSDALELEWSRHQSRFARRWLIAMESKRRVFHIGMPTQRKLRLKVQRAAETKTASDAMLKDMLLIEAAYYTDKIIISLDETVRKYFDVTSEHVPALKYIIWVNPCITEEIAIDWLKSGAELRRNAGYRGKAAQVNETIEEQQHSLAPTDHLKRIVVVGVSGAGKTALARLLARRLDLSHIELNALFWEANWTQVTSEVFRERVAQALCADRWVVDGNYNQVRDLTWSQADTVVWLDYGLGQF